MHTSLAECGSCRMAPDAQYAAAAADLEDRRSIALSEGGIVRIVAGFALTAAVATARFRPLDSVRAGATIDPLLGPIAGK